MNGIAIEKLAMQNYIFTATIEFKFTYTTHLTEGKQTKLYLYSFVQNTIIIKWPFNWQSDPMDFAWFIDFLKFHLWD